MRQLEQAKQENSTTTTSAAAEAASATESSNTSDNMQSTSILNQTADRMENGYPVETAIISEN